MPRRSNIKNEFTAIDLGDERRNRRFAALAGALAASPSASVSGACQDAAQTKAAYRLVNSEEVTSQKVLEAHRASTMARARLCKEPLLFVQDTTELEYTGHPSMRGLGPIGSVTRRGFFLHNHLLVAEESGVPLGLCGAQIITRCDKNHGKKPRANLKLPIEEKESFRWLTGYEEACVAARELPGRQVLMVADRECDMYDVFARHDELLQAGAPCA